MHATQNNRETIHPDPADAASYAIAQAWNLRRQRRWKDAEEACRSVLADNPKSGTAWHLLGLLAIDGRRPAQAVAYMEQAIAIEPGQPAHHGNLGYALISLHQYAQAESCLLKALEISPDFYDARCNLGLVYYHQNHLEKAAKCFKEILSVQPDDVAALVNLGMTRLAQQRYAEAAKAYEMAVSLDPNQAQWHGNLGAAYIRLGRFDKSAHCYRRASALAPTAPEFDIYQSIALRADGDLPESIRLLQGVMAEDPSQSMAIAHLVVALEYTCQWEHLDLYHAMLDQATSSDLAGGRRPDEDPMLNIRRSNDVVLNQAVSRAWSHHLQEKGQRSNVQLKRTSARRHHRRIKIGYLSYDFRNHPVAHQIFPLFGMHDRSRFHTVALSMGPDDDSSFRRIIEADCDEFIDISELGLAEACETIWNHEIDILVDLMGHSHHNRMEILAHRPAPVQVGYLGFLSTTGARFIDYLIADAKVVPKEHESYYDEKLLRMPHCYQLSHTDLIVTNADRRRADWGLPTDGFIFCCFNTVYKIDRELFDTWMRILLRVPGSVIWLNGGHQMARQHMRSRAQMLGIDPDRLIFAEKIALEDHLQRLPLADVALDTLRYNGGATTANALGCGVPVLTVMGRHWVSRMSASQLIAAKLPDLVFPSIAAYEHAAIDLALDNDKLQAVRQRLKASIPTCPLFDHQGFVEQLEKGFEIIWQRHMEGLEPDHIEIPLSP